MRRTIGANLQRNKDGRMQRRGLDRLVSAAPEREQGG